MKKKQFTWIAVFVALLPLEYLALIWPSLPPTVAVHFDIEMKPDTYGSKSKLWMVAGIMTAVSLATYFLLTNVHRFDPKRKGRNESSTFAKLGLGMVVFMAAFSLLIITSANDHGTARHLVFPLLGLLLAFVGNYMNNLKPNYVAGFRLPWTLSDDENWRKTHQLGGKLWFAGGMLTAVLCLFLPSGVSFIVFISVIVIIVLIPAVYSYRLFKNHSQV